MGKEKSSIPLAKEKVYTRKDVLYHQVVQEELDEEQEFLQNKINLDEIFQYIGNYGKYQKLLTWLVVLPACIPCGLQGFNQLFMANDLNHWCKIPEILRKETNFTTEELKLLALPLLDDESNETSSCLIRNVDWTSLLYHSMGNETVFDGDIDKKNEMTSTMSASYKAISSSYSLSASRPKKDYDDLMDELKTKSWQLILCPNGWDYEGTNSIVKDFDLVCGREIYPTIALFLVNLGGLIGVFVFGTLSDVVGRKASFFLCLTCEMIGGIGCTFAQDFWTWTVFRVVTGLTVPAIYQIPFIICLELVGPTHRAFVTVMTSFFYVGGMMLLPLIAYLEPDWKLLSLYTTVPFLLYYGYIWFMPESPRWLLAQGRSEEALKILNVLARVNGKSVPTSVVDKIESLVDHQRKEKVKMKQERSRKSERGNQRSLLDLFRTPNMRLKTILLTLCWFSNCTVYVGLSYYGPSLGENPYLSFFLSSAIEIPGYFLCWILMDSWGRRWPLCIFMLVGGMFDVATVLLSSDSTTMLMCFYLIAKLGVSASYLIIYPFAAELYPTEIRGIGLGFSAYIGGIGLCCIPLINYLGKQNLVIPLVTMGLLSIMGGLAGLRLPETLNAPLPTTLEEGENFGKYFTWQDCFRCWCCSRTEEDDNESFYFETDSTSVPKFPNDQIGKKQKKSSQNNRPENEIIQLEDMKNVFIHFDEKEGNESDKQLHFDDRSMGISLASPSPTISQMNESTSPTNNPEISNNSPSIPATTSTYGPSNRRSTKRKLVRQGSSTFEAPTDSSGAFIITPWW